MDKNSSVQAETEHCEGKLWTGTGIVPESVEKNLQDQVFDMKIVGQRKAVENALHAV